MKSEKADAPLLAELFSERARLRERLLSGVLWSVVAAFGFASPWTLFHDARTSLSTVIVFGISLLAVLSMAALRQLPFQLRLSVLMACLYITATTAIVLRGYTPNAFLVLGVMVVLATLIGGRRWGLITVAVTASTMLCVTLLQHWGTDYRTSDWASYSDSSRGVVMTRVTAIFVLVSIIFVVAISYVVARSEQLVEQLLRSVTALQAEQAEKTRIMADLVQREAALETLNHTLEQRVEERTASLQQANASLTREMQVRLKREVELRQAQKLESIGRLAAGLAHELNTPLQFISDSVHFVRDAQLELSRLAQQYRAALLSVANGEPADRALETTLQHEERCDLTYLRENVPAALAQSIDGLKRVARIVQTLKEFAHADQQSMVPTDLNQAIQNTLVIAHHEYGKVAELVTEFAELPPVLCYPGDINQAVLNVIVNAAHAIAERDPDARRPGRISVRTRREGDQVVVSVSDTGAGIPEAIRERVYDPFFTTKDVGRGTGQGLTITRSVIRDKHGGDVSFETTLGQGTTFYLRLPIDGSHLVERAS